MAIGFRRRLHVGDPLLVLSRIERIGRSSIGIRQTLFCGPLLGAGKAEG